jgi:type II secretion system protein C
MLTLALAFALAAPPDLTAVGVVVSARAERSVALLKSGGRTRVVGVGENAFGGRLVAVRAGAVTLEYDGQRFDLALAEGAPLVAAAPRVAPAADAGRVLERRDVERRLGEEASRILAETTLVPAMDGSRVAGYTLTRVPEGTLLTEAGLQPGDVLTEINDVPIDSMATLVSLWPRLQGETRLRAVILRNGQPLSLTVSLR